MFQNENALGYALKAYGMKLLVDGTPLLRGGGVQVAIALLFNLQSSPDVEWTAILPHEIRHALPLKIANDGRILFLRKYSFWQKLLLRYLLRRVERNTNPDIVFTVFGPAYFRAEATHLVGFALPNMVYDDVGLGKPSLRTRLVNLWRRSSLKKASHLVVETEVVKTRLASRLNYDSKRITVIGNSVNPALVRVEGQPSKRFRILVPSAYYPHKNLEVIPRVAMHLIELAPNFDFEFVLTLESISPNWKRIAQNAELLGAGQRVLTLGPVNIADLGRVYANASAVFLPTLIEVSTAVYPESFFFGRPLVTSNRDFARELCGEAALFVDPFNPLEIARTLLILAEDRELISKLVSAGSQRLAEKFPTPSQKFAMQLKLLSQCQAG